MGTISRMRALFLAFIVAAGVVGVGTATMSVLGPSEASVQAGQIAYSPVVNNKQSKRKQPPRQTPPGAPHPGHW